MLIFFAITTGISKTPGTDITLTLKDLVKHLVAVYNNELDELRNISKTGKNI